MSKKPQIILVDDHPLFREGIKLLIEKENIGEVIAEAENGTEFLKLLEKLKPDLVLMDIAMPEMDGYEATKLAINKYPGLKILAISMFSDKENYENMISAGTMGFVLKTSGKNELEKAIKNVAKGESYFSAELLRQIIVNFDKDKEETVKKKVLDILTAREFEVLQCFCRGLTSSEIAEELFVSVKTIEAHRSKLIQKTKTKNTLNLVLFAIKNSLVDLE